MRKGGVQIGRLHLQVFSESSVLACKFDMNLLLRPYCERLPPRVAIVDRSQEAEERGWKARLDQITRFVASSYAEGRCEFPDGPPTCRFFESLWSHAKSLLEHVRQHYMDNRRTVRDLTSSFSITIMTCCLVQYQVRHRALVVLTSSHPFPTIRGYVASRSS